MKKYIKPEMETSLIEMDPLCELTMSSTEYDDSMTIRSKSRGSMTVDEEEWVRQTDMWGNESWSRSN